MHRKGKAWRDKRPLSSPTVPPSSRLNPVLLSLPLTQTQVFFCFASFLKQVAEEEASVYLHSDECSLFYGANKTSIFLFSLILTGLSSSRVCTHAYEQALSVQRKILTCVLHQPAHLHQTANFMRLNQQSPSGVSVLTQAWMRADLSARCLCSAVESHKTPALYPYLTRGPSRRGSLWVRPRLAPCRVRRLAVE